MRPSGYLRLTNDHEGSQRQCQSHTGRRHRPEPPRSLVWEWQRGHKWPDTWKQAALNKIAAMLRPGGLFYIWDAM